MRNFKQLHIWNRGVDLAVEVYRLTEQFPKEERFGLRSQMTRASFSIPSNVAEGSSRESEADYRRYLEIAPGSAFELETQLTIAQRVGLVSAEALQPSFVLVEEAQRMLQAFIQRLTPKR